MNTNDTQPAHVDRAKVNWLSAKLAGQPVTSPPGEPKPADSALTSGIGALLRKANDGTLTPEEEATARGMIENMGLDILAAAEDSTSSQHGLAHKILQLFIQFAGGAA